MAAPIRPDAYAHQDARQTPLAVALFHAEVPAAQAAAAGATIINIHHGGSANPHINYPFLALEQLAARVNDAHAHGLKLKIYYTLRELTSYCAEFWALRSLGNEIFYPGPVSRRPWRRPTRRRRDQSWSTTTATNRAPRPLGRFAPHRQRLVGRTRRHRLLAGLALAAGNGRFDAAVNLLGQTRWENYYVASLAWLLKM